MTTEHPASTAADDFEIRQARAGDEPGILEVLNASFPHWPPCEAPEGQRAYLDWVLAHPDTSTPRYPLVACDGARIVGVRLSTGRPYLVLGEERRGTRTASVANHPDVRGRGLYSRTQRWLTEHYPEEWSYAWTMAAEVQHLEESATPTVDNRLLVLLRVLNPLAEGRSQPGLSVRNALKYLPLKLGGDARRLRRRVGAARPSWTVRVADRFDERVEQLSRTAASEFDLIPLRVPDELNWRYRDERAGHFELLVAEAGGELLGYAVFAVREDRGHVVDLLAAPGRLDVVENLLAKVEEACGVQGASSIECWLPARHPYSTAARRAGYFRLGRRSREMEHSFAIRALTEDARALRLVSEGGRIHVMEGDCNEI